MKPELSILITSYKNPGLLELCLGYIKQNVQGFSYEVIVADSATEEDTSYLMEEQFPEVTFLPNNYNTGFGTLVNQGLAVAKGEYAFIINADIIIKDKSAVAELLQFLKRNPDVGIVGPALINIDGSVQPSRFRFYRLLTIVYRRTFLKKLSFAKKHLSWFTMEKEVSGDGALDVDWIMGASMMLPRAVFSQVGEMDAKRFFMYFEDVDWCWRVWEKGYRVVYYPKVRVFHYHGKASANQSALGAVLFNKYTRIHIESAIKFFIKFWGKDNPHLAYEKKVKNNSIT